MNFIKGKQKWAWTMIALTLYLPFLLNIQLTHAYHDARTLARFNVTQDMNDEIDRIYVHFYAMVPLHHAVYLNVLFTHFRASFMADFRGASLGRASRLLRLLNDFHFLPQQYRTVRSGVDFGDLKKEWTAFRDRPRPLPPIPANIQIPVVFEAMYPDERDNNIMVPYDVVFRDFMIYPNQYATYSGRMNPFSNE